MRVLLIFPPTTTYGADPTIPAIIPPLGLAYLAGYLERDGFEVKVLDARLGKAENEGGRKDARTYGLSDEEILGEISAFAPDLVGISCMYTAYSGDTHRVARVAKTYSRDVPVVLGGAHASAFPDLAVRDPNVDAVIVGEGEETLLEIARSIRNGRISFSVRGTVVLDGETVIRNPTRPFIEDLDSIPFPGRHLLNMKGYLAVTKQYPLTMRRPSTTFVTSRGCPKECVYCSIQPVWGVRKWRGRSPNNVVDEFEHLIDAYGVSEFHWMDDSAATNRNRIEGICREIIERRMDIKWTTPNGIAHWELNESRLDLMKRAGCYRVTFGVESGNEEMRRFIGKPHPLGQAKRVIRHANSIGMWTLATFIIGFPHETEAQIRETIDFAVESGVDMAIFYLLIPVPGTQVYEILKRDGLVSFESFLDVSRRSFLTTEELAEIGTRMAGLGTTTRLFEENELREFVTDAYTRFLHHRVRSIGNVGRWLRKIRSYEDLAYMARLGVVFTPSVVRLITSKRFTIHDLWPSRKDMAGVVEERLSPPGSGQ